MPAAVLFRGHAFRPPRDGFSCRDWGVDWRLCVESHRRFLLDPLRERYGGVHVFLVSYDFPAWGDAVRDYQPVDTLLSPGGSTQRGTFLMGLDLVSHYNRLRQASEPKAPPYDLVVTCRFDVELLKCPLDHGTFRPDAVNFLWREWEQKAWDDHRRVPDAIHLLPGDLLDPFRAGVAATPSEVCMHMVWHPVARLVGEHRMHVMEPDGFRDSNTDKGPNPVYRMVRVK